jgi:O-antigen ligase
MKIVQGTKIEIALFGILFATWIMPESIYVDIGIIVRPLDIAVIILGVGCILTQLKNGKIWLYKDKTSIIFAIFILWGASSFLWAEHKTQVLIETIQWLEIFLIFIFLSSLLKTEEHLKQFIFVFLGFAFLLQLIQGLYPMAVLFHIVPYSRERLDPLFAVLVIVFLHALIVEKHYVIGRYWMLVLIFLSIFNLLVSLTRKGIIGCALSIGLLITLSSKNIRGFLQRIVVYCAVITILIGTISISLPGLQKRLLARFLPLTGQAEKLGGGIEGRLTHFVISYNIFRERPLTGIGLGNHYHEFRDFFTQLFEKKSVEKTGGVHNGFLLVLSELGLIGLTIILCLFLRPVRLIILYRKYGQVVRYPGILLGAASIYPFVVIKFGTAHSGLGRVFPLVFILAITNAYERITLKHRIAKRVVSRPQVSFA